MIPDDLSNHLFHAVLLTFGAALSGVAYAIAGWLVGLFAPTLPLPPGTHLAVTIVLYSVLVYFVALEPNDDGETRLDAALGRLA